LVSIDTHTFFQRSSKHYGPFADKNSRTNCGRTLEAFESMRSLRKDIWKPPRCFPTDASSAGYQPLELVPEGHMTAWKPKVFLMLKAPPLKQTKLCIFHNKDVLSPEKFLMQRSCAQKTFTKFSFCPQDSFQGM
jgi:hypothetical protein